MADLNGIPATADELQALALVNYGHFTSMRVDNQHIRGLSHHLERLVRDCRTLFAADLDRDQIRDQVRRVVDSRTGSFVVRVTVYDPALQLGHPGGETSPSVLVTTRAIADTPATPWRVKSAAYARDLPAVKHIGLFGALWHRRSAQLTGFDDALFVDPGSYISEGPTWNIAFYDGTNVVWPNADVLPGITMRLLQQVHDATSLAPVNLRDLDGMEAAFATNTTIGVRAITAIDNLEFPADHPIFETLRKEYGEIPAESL